MSDMTKGFLKPLDKPSPKSISVRLPAELHERFDEVKARAEKHGLTISITDIVTAAVRDACDYADSYLENQNNLAELEAAQTNGYKMKTAKS